MDPEPPAFIDHIILDKEGDTIIILPYYTESSEHQSSEDRECSKESAEEGGEVHGEEHGEDDDEDDDEQDDGEHNEQDPQDDDQAFSEDNAEENDYKEPVSSYYQDSEAKPADNGTELHELHLKVSKKHLMAASHRARIALSGGYAESNAASNPDGMHHWAFEPFFDPDAFELVMNIIHGHTKHVPIELELGTLAKVAAVVDDLRCEDAVWFFAKLWIRNLDNLPLGDTFDNLSRWIMISSVFNEPDIFARCTRKVIVYTTGSLPTRNEFHIWPSILDAIQNSKREALDNLLFQVQILSVELGQSTSECTSDCRSALLGALSRGMNSFLTMPWPTEAYYAMSLPSATASILNIRSPAIYGPRDDSVRSWDDNGVWHLERPDRGVWALQPQDRRDWKNIWSPHRFGEDEDLQPELIKHSCNLRELLEPRLTRVAYKVVGLELADFVWK